MNTEPLRVCTTCAVHHYENCGTCLGFGIYDPEFARERWGAQTIAVPVLAAEAIPDPRDATPGPRGPVAPCPECGSTEKGVPS